MIEFQNVSKSFGSLQVLKNINLKIDSGEFVLLTGKSGAGKTTLIKLLLGEEKPTQGEVLFEGIKVSKIPPSQLPFYRRNFGIVFQDYKLLTSRTVFENVAFTLEVIGVRDEEIEENVIEALEIVDMLERKDYFPHQLSGGEKQRIALARAIIHQPKVLIADEPTGNLDPYHSWEIIKLLQKIHNLGKTVILATHDKEIVNSLRKRVITLDQGKVVRDEKEGVYVI